MRFRGGSFFLLFGACLANRDETKKKASAGFRVRCVARRGRARNGRAAAAAPRQYPPAPAPLPSALSDRAQTLQNQSVRRQNKKPPTNRQKTAKNPPKTRQKHTETLTNQLKNLRRQAQVGNTESVTKYTQNIKKKNNKTPSHTEIGDKQTKASLVASPCAGTFVTDKVVLIGLRGSVCGFFFRFFFSFSTTLLLRNTLRDTERNSPTHKRKSGTSQPLRKPTVSGRFGTVVEVFFFYVDGGGRGGGAMRPKSAERPAPSSQAIGFKVTDRSIKGRTSGDRRR